MKRVLAAGQRLTRPVVLACVAVILGSLAFVLCTLALNTGSEDKTSDWISAFGTVFGAALTGGALMVAAFTYKHQIDERARVAEDRRQQELEKRSEQAKSVTVSITEKPHDNKTLEIRVINGSTKTIKSVFLVLVDKRRGEPFQQPYYTLAPGAREGFDRPASIVGGAYATFIDADGRRWRSWFNGDLEERIPSTTAASLGDE